MNLLSDLKNYIPFNEEEASDKEAFIRFLETNNDVYSRNNTIAHVTSSSWIVNKERTKVLMAYHNIYNSWSWSGGHNDDDIDCLNVAIKEAKEETGIEEVKLIYNGIFSIESLHVEGHYKRGKYVSSHIHYNVTYLLEANEKDTLKIKEDENSGVRWIEINELEKMVSEKWMFDHIYQKLLNKLKTLK